jgi:uncharacterized protein (TIGR03435 family)
MNRVALPILLLVTMALARPQGSRPSFEVASIRPTERVEDFTFTSGIKVSGESVSMRRVTVGMLVHAAYGLKARFVSAPRWVEYGPAAFDIRAIFPKGTPARLVPEMIQGLLEERFKLAFHIEQQERTVYALLAAKDGPKLQPSSSIDESMPGGAASGVSAVAMASGSPVWTSPSGSTYRISFLPDGGAQMTLTGVSLAEFAAHLNTLDGVDIVDMTQLTGHYDFTWTAARHEMCELCPDPPPTAPRPSTPSVRESLERMGLRLERVRTRVSVFVVDRAEETPSEN